MNYNEALEYIHSVQWLGSRPGLSRTFGLLSALGNPQNDLKFVHVAGTNGKGSTCSMLSSVLMEAGYKVGLYTSPYIVRFNERMRINGVDIPDEELAELVEIIKPIADQMEDKPTEFEIITAIGFLYFKKHNCDIVVLEVGMGGRLDSTNVIEKSEVSIITGIALDHTSYLGDTVEKVAIEKAGIIKNDCPVVYGGRDDSAFAVISEKAKETGSQVVRTDIPSVDIKYMNIDGIVFDYNELEDIKLSLVGSYQVENALTVIEAVKILKERDYNITKENLYTGLCNAKWSARFEVLAKEPFVVFDGSHNIQGVTAAAETIKNYFKHGVILLMGVLADKDFGDMVDLLSPLVHRAFTVTPDSPRALKSDKLANVFYEAGVCAYHFDTVEQGVASAYQYAKEKNLPLVMLGSLYMYGEVKNAFDKIINN